jgi:putative ABC transport system permease protein
VLAFAGGGLGLALAYGALNLLLLLAPEGAADGLRPSLDVYVVLFCAAAAALSGALFGIVPAWRISRTNPNETLKTGRSSASERQGLRSALVVAETALALILLASAGLFLRSFIRLQSVSPGFDPRGVMTAEFSLPQNTYPGGQKQTVFYRTLLGKLRTAPGVGVAALGSPIPFGRGEGSASFLIDGRPATPGDPGPHGDIRFVTPGYFEALSIPLKSGRYFTDDDRVTAERVAIIDESLARRYWPDEDPLGQKIRWGGSPSTIVGVVGHVTHSDLAADSGRGAYYFTMFQRAVPTASIVVKTPGDVAPMAAAIREAVRAVDPQQAVHTFRPMDDLVSASLAPRQFAMRLLGFFGAMALFLAALGLYGVISYSVAQRTREIGIRVALGASTRSVIGEVVGQGLRLAGIGVALGIAGAILCGRFLASQLFQVTPFDPLTLSAMAAALLTAAFIASYLPALRAARVDPVTALRNE